VSKESYNRNSLKRLTNVDVRFALRNRVVVVAAGGVAVCAVALAGPAAVPVVYTMLPGVVTGAGAITVAGGAVVTGAVLGLAAYNTFRAVGTFRKTQAVLESMKKCERYALGFHFTILIDLIWVFLGDRRGKCRSGRR
jgi:hypothetical protein